MADKTIYYARDLLEKGQDFVIAKVVDSKGSTPRKKGAWMLLRQDGTTSGTVGGGVLEAETEKLCLKTLQTKEKDRIYHFRLNGEEQHALDMRCGGDVHVQIQYIDAEHPEDFVQDFGVETTAFIFGAGHVAKALEPVLRHVDFRTVVIDDRAEFANRDRFPQAEEIRVIPDFKKAFEGINIDMNSFIVIVTRGHAGDYDVLKEALRKEPAYIGLMGSKKKNAFLFDMLRQDGFSEADIARIYAPVGLPINAETPEEIAISVAAEMIKVRAGRD